MKEACTHDYLLAYLLAWMEVWSKLLSLKHLSEIEKVGRSVKADDRIPGHGWTYPGITKVRHVPSWLHSLLNFQEIAVTSPDDYNIVYFNCSQWSVNSC
jgi:hypothetical protein